MLEMKYLRDGQALAVASTYKVDLPNSGKLSAIMLQFSGDEVAGFGQAGGVWRILDYLTRIRVIGDGSEIIVDLTGKQALAKWFFDHGEVTPSVWRNYAGNTQFETIGLTFGRKLGDRMLGLDLSKFGSVQLEITNTAAAAQFAAGFACSICMIQHHSELNPPMFQGHIRTEAWREWTTVQNAWEYLELPKSYKLRRIMLQAIPSKTTGLDATTCFNLMDDIKLALKTGALEIVRMGMDDICRLNGMTFGMPIQHISGEYWTADTAHENGIGYWLGVAGQIGTQDGAVAAVMPTMTWGDTGGTPRFESYEGDSIQSLLVKGLAPHYCAIPYQSELDDPADYLDLTAQATALLDIHTRNAASAAGGTNHVILERLVS